MSEKKFGLVIPQKADKFKMRSNPVFGNDSDDDEEEHKRPKIPQKKHAIKNKIKQEPLEDPSIYEYDSIYDEMKAKEAESIAPKEKKNSRYIGTLLKAAERRKKEYERRVDKKIQLEREKEGDLYEDKEAFVTSSYKKKLQENEEAEERERRENILNDMMDITKQKDLSGFYRHFLKQTIGEEKVPVFGEKYQKQEVTSSRDNNSPTKIIENIKDNKTLDYTSIDQDSDDVNIHSDSDDENSYTIREISNKSHTVIENTNMYNDSKEEILEINSNKDSMFKDKSNLQQRKKFQSRSRKTSNTSESSSESSDNENVTHSKKGCHSHNYESRKLFIHHPRHDSLSSDSNEANKKSDDIKEQDKFEKKDNNTRKNIYGKRTIEDVFIEAQAKYFKRMKK